MIKTKAVDINEKSTWQELTTGAEIYEGATSRLVNTGEWRVDRPAKGLTLILCTARAAAYARKYVLSALSLWLRRENKCL